MEAPPGISALIYCGMWMVLGVIWIRIATTPIRGMVVIAVNAAIVVGLVALASSRRAFRLPA